MCERFWTLLRAEDFRAKAAEAERQAEIVGESKLRADYLKVAHAWRQMADQLEALETQFGIKLNSLRCALGLASNYFSPACVFCA